VRTGWSAPLVTMSQSKTLPPVRGPHAAAPAKPAPAAPAPASSAGKSGAAAAPRQAAGKVVHDERGNAVWDWLKETGRMAIEGTTRMLRRLETPELKMEDTRNQELRLQDDSSKCAGGGYDPYNQANRPTRPPKGSK
jgi:hypothetical protein